MTSTRDRGSGVIGTSLGFLIFTIFLLATVQILFRLYATSAVTAAAVDAASAVAGHDAADERCEAAAQAETALRQSLGDYARMAKLVLTWTCDDPEVVRLRVRARGPNLLGMIDRTVEVRVETLR